MNFQFLFKLKIILIIIMLNEYNLSKNNNLIFFNEIKIPSWNIISLKKLVIFFFYSYIFFKWFFPILYFGYAILDFWLRVQFWNSSKNHISIDKQLKTIKNRLNAVHLTCLNIPSPHSRDYNKSIIKFFSFFI